MVLPRKLQEWAAQPGAKLFPVHETAVRELSAICESVGYGFAQQVIEWLWQEKVEGTEFAGSAWGPEYFEKRIAELEKENDELRNKLECE